MGAASVRHVLPGPVQLLSSTALARLFSCLTSCVGYRFSAKATFVYLSLFAGSQRTVQGASCCLLQQQPQHLPPKCALGRKSVGKEMRQEENARQEEHDGRRERGRRGGTWRYLAKADLGTLGASAGIGESTAKHFATLGCWLSLTGRNTANLERVADACCVQGLPREKVLVVPGDVTVEKDIADVVQRTAKHFGRIDILVNNAGIPMPGSVQSTSKEEFNRAWRTNLFGPLCMIKNAVPYLRQTKENAPYGVRVNLIR
ncbi:dehydrogenase/reductase SDR family member 7B-like isoform X9 [Dermacentor albipictus]|uniref:dehydrogenase/reductase SDR family member 7B-like isoform X9 n=1 Tax=Dermacentor albipictus TaxID=60249 RepID=UPI0031FC249B